jgi:hypothetical protein
MLLKLKALPILSILSLAVFTACGGGGSASSLTTFSGVVVDGYIEGATVCLDLNANQTCDPGEPRATSKFGGAYSLDVSGMDADKLKAAHLMTVVPDSAKDADDGGKTLKEAGKKTFNLMAPVAAFVNSDGMFGVKEGFVHNGYFRFASAKNFFYPFFNKTMINAILNAGQKPVVLN